MVRFSLAAVVVAIFLAGCSPAGNGAGTFRAEAVTLEERIAELEARTDMPPEVQRQAIESLRRAEQARTTAPAPR